jgi:uncharacterized LabA/DUF88 family protein
VFNTGFFIMVKRVSVYIDGANFYGGLISLNKKFTDSKFDFARYVDSLVKKNRLVEIKYYNAFVKKDVNEKIWQKQSDLFARLNKIPKCMVRLCTRKSRWDNFREEYHIIKGDDIMLALDMVEDCYEDKFDVGILISGDGDFLELVKKIKKKSKKVMVCYFENCVSKVLLRNVDESKVINKKIVKKFFWS